MDWKSTRFTSRIAGFRAFVNPETVAAVTITDHLNSFKEQYNDAFIPVDMYVDDRSFVIIHKDMCKAFGLSSSDQLFDYAKKMTKTMIAGFYDKYISNNQSGIYQYLTNIEKDNVLKYMEDIFRAIDQLNLNKQLIDQTMKEIIHQELGDVWSLRDKVDLDKADLYIFNHGDIEALSVIHEKLRDLWFTLASNGVNHIDLVKHEISCTLAYLTLCYADSVPGQYYYMEDLLAYESINF